MLAAVMVMVMMPPAAPHGRLMNPAARNAMWRFGFPNPVNYNDNELYCGGYVVQFQKNGGNCGVCGDDYSKEEPRPHEAGGIYANGLITTRYVTGQDMEVEAELTTNHKGNMKLELCPSDDPYTVVTDECFKRYPLQMADGSGPEFVIPEDSKKTEIFTWKVKLPEGVSCAHCVVRWTYAAANTWGICPNGTESVGCGPQETFINCADISILVNTATHASQGFNPWAAFAFFRRAQSNHLDAEQPSDNGGELANASEGIIATPGVSPLPWGNIRTRPVVRSQVCIPTSQYQGVDGMQLWCTINCLKYEQNCPPEYCVCIHDCTAVGEFALQDQSDLWCHQHCLRHPSVCPAERCACT